MLPKWSQPEEQRWEQFLPLRVSQSYEEDGCSKAEVKYHVLGAGEGGGAERTEETEFTSELQECYHEWGGGRGGLCVASFKDNVPVIYSYTTTPKLSGLKQQSFSLGGLFYSNEE